MDLLIDILLALLILGALAALALVPFALSRLYIIWGRMVNNTFMIVLLNGSLVKILMKSQTASFQGGDDAVERFNVLENNPDHEQSAGILPFIGWVPVLFYAQRVKIPINFIDVIRPQKEGDRVIYRLVPMTINTRTPPRIIVHGFETTPVETRGHERPHGKKAGEEFEDGNLVALVTEVLQITIHVKNPYLAYVRMMEDGTGISEAGQKFMHNLNGTIQSTAREVTAMFTYNELIKAQVENSSSGQQPGDDATKKKRKRHPMRVKFGRIFKRIANKSLAAYGLYLEDVDMLDHALDKEMAEYLQKPQKAAYEARATVIEATGDKEKKELLAIGDAAELRELLTAANGDKDLVREEIRRRGKERAAEKVGENYDGQYLSVNLGDGNTPMPPQPSVLGGSVGFKTPTKEKQGA